MPIIEFSNTYIRDRVFEFIRKMREENPYYTIIDIGGALNPWCDEFVTTYMDFNEVPTKREVLIGDIMEEAFWKGIGDRHWHFAICTHVLEDIRDPLYLVKKIHGIAKAGFIAVPNKHTELSSVESPQYPGYYHHRWIFTLEDQVFRAIAKIPLLGYYRASNRWLHFLTTGGPLLKRIAGRLAPNAIPGGGMPEWYDASKARHEYELGFIWEEGFRFEYYDGDYCGPDQETMVNRYAEALARGL